MHNFSEAPTQLFIFFLLLYLFVKFSSWELHKNFQVLKVFLSCYSVPKEILLM